MKKATLLTVLIVSFSLMLISFAKATRSTNNSTVVAATALETDSSINEEVTESAATALYQNLHLEETGLTLETVEYAINGYNKLNAQGKVKNPYLTIIDMSKSGREKRFYIIDMANPKLVWNTYVSHGKNSGLDMATKFSNAFNSEASSLGFYITTATYNGKHGLSLRLSGQENGFNNNAEARGVVVHGAPYVNAGRVNSAYMGRSQGCPALPVMEYAKIINIIKGGSVMFIYHPTKNYIQSSRLING